MLKFLPTPSRVGTATRVAVATFIGIPSLFAAITLHNVAAKVGGYE